MARLNFRHLGYFHAIVEAGGLTRAAERLHVSPSALSIQVQQLEAQLGHALFERRGRRMLLTEAGRIALDRAEAIFAAGDELVSTLKGLDSASRRVIRVGALSTLSRNFQVQFLRPILGRQDVEIVLRSGSVRELLQLLEAHRIDVLLTNTVPPRDAATPWTPHLIAEQPISLIGRTGDGAPPLPLKELLADRPLILPTVETAMRAEFDALADRLDVRPQIAAEVDDMAMLRLLAREGIGLAVVPPIVVRDELAAGVLAEIERLPGLNERFFAVTPTRRFPNPLVRQLVARGDVAAGGA